MAKITLNQIGSGYLSTTALNQIINQIEDALDNSVLWRSPPLGEPNQMETDLDLGGNDILNTGTIDTSNITVAGQPLLNFLFEAAETSTILAAGYADDALNSSINASGSASLAANSANDAALSAANAAGAAVASDLAATDAQNSADDAAQSAADAADTFSQLDVTVRAEAVEVADPNLGFSVGSRTDLGATGATWFDPQFTPDGLTLYIFNEGTETLDEYTLPAPYDISSISGVPVSSQATINGESTTSTYFSSDGTLYYEATLGQNVEQYTLSTPYDLSTATNTGTRALALASGGITVVDGTNTLITCAQNNARQITVYPLTDPNNFGGGLDGGAQSYTLSIPGGTSVARGRVSQDGTRWAGVNFSNDDLVFCGFAVPYDFDTAQGFVQDLNLSASSNGPNQVGFTDDPMEVVVTSSSFVDAITTYRVGTKTVTSVVALEQPYTVIDGTNIDFAADTISLNGEVLANNAALGEGAFLDVGTGGGDLVDNDRLQEALNEGLNAFNPAHPIEVARTRYTEFIPGITASTMTKDGTSVVWAVASDGNVAILQASMSTPFNLQTLGALSANQIIGGSTRDIRHLVWSNDGTSLHCLQNTNQANDIVYTLSVTTPFDLSTVTGGSNPRTMGSRWTTLNIDPASSIYFNPNEDGIIFANYWNPLDEHGVGFATMDTPGDFSDIGILTGLIGLTTQNQVQGSKHVRFALHDTGTSAGQILLTFLQDTADPDNPVINYRMYLLPVAWDLTLYRMIRQGVTGFPFIDGLSTCLSLQFGDEGKHLFMMNEYNEIPGFRHHYAHLDITAV